MTYSALPRRCWGTSCFAYQAINGVSFAGHNGGTPGYAGEIDIYPRTGDVVVMLTNQDQVLVPAIQRSQALLTS